MFISILVALPIPSTSPYTTSVLYSWKSIARTSLHLFSHFNCVQWLNFSRTATYIYIQGGRDKMGLINAQLHQLWLIFRFEKPAPRVSDWDLTRGCNYVAPTVVTPCIVFFFFFLCSRRISFCFVVLYAENMLLLKKGKKSTLCRFC